MSSMPKTIKKEEEDEEMTTEETWLLRIKEETPSCLEEDTGFFERYAAGAGGVEGKEDDGRVPSAGHDQEEAGSAEKTVADSGLILTISVKPEPQTAQGSSTTEILKSFRMEKKSHSDGNLKENLEKGKASANQGSMKAQAFFPCPVCGMVFDEEKKARAHRSAHSTFPCDVCGKICKTLGAMIRHKEDHPGEKPHKCTRCDKSFSELRLLVHASSCHDACGELVCHVCNKSFSKNEEYLKRHLKRHTEAGSERRFKCTVCGKTFTTKSSLVRHGSTHTGERPFECDVCGKAFRWASNLKEHKLLHMEDEPHVCGECGRCFKSKCAFSLHTRRHKIPPKLVKCPHCSKSFQRKSRAEAHIRQRHTGERPYACDICGKRFAGRDNIREHVKVVHGKEKPPNYKK